MAFTMTVAELIDADTSGLLGKHTTWERVQLAEVATILNGAPFDSALFNTTGGMPLIRIRDVTTGQTDTYYTGPYEDAYLVQHGDLLVGMDGDFNSGFWGPKTSLLNQRVCKISPFESLYDKRLLAFTLPGYLAAINANTPSVTVKHLSSKTIGEIGLPLPPRSEQARIVAKLEELLSDLDAGVAELKAAQKKLAQYRQSLLKAAVTGELTAKWRAESASQISGKAENGSKLLQRILTERCARWEDKQLAKFKAQGKTPPKDWQKKYPEPVQPDTTGLPELPELPEGWVYASLDQLLLQLRSGSAETSSRETTDFPVLKSSAVRPGSIDYSALNYLTLTQSRIENRLESGDLLISRLSGSVEYVGCCAQVFSLPAHGVQYPDRLFCGKLVAHTETLGAYIVISVSSPYARAKIEKAAKSTAGHKRISLSDLHPFAIALPPLQEAQELIRLMDIALSEIAQQESAVRLALKQSTAQRQNILRAAFAGQLVPQDPADEPASVLLARIRAERAQREAVKKPRSRKPKEAA